MFTGFERGAFEYFMALGFNNNREFFHDNHDWYERSVRSPLRELCMDLAPVMLELDPDLEVRPAKVISHINRDLRYSRDKSPYRDYMWLGFHRAGRAKSDCFSLYFDIGTGGVHMGAGLYSDDKRWTDALRAAIRDDTEHARGILLSPALDGFALGGSTYRRMVVPENIDAALAAWYIRKGIYLEHTFTEAEAMTGALVDDMAARYRSLKPIYDFMYSIKPAAPESSDEFSGEGNFKRIASKAGYAPDTPDGWDW